MTDRPARGRVASVTDRPAHARVGRVTDRPARGRVGRVTDRPARGRVGRVTDRAFECLGFDTTARLSSSSTEINSLSRVVKGGVRGDTLDRQYGTIESLG